MSEYALTFNGSNQYGGLDLSASYAYTSGTVECWFKTSVNLNDYQGLVIKNSVYGMYIYNNKLAVYDGNTYTGAANVNNDIWHHAAFVFQVGVTNGSKLFLDGVALIPSPATASSFTYGSASPNQGVSLAIASGRGDTVNKPFNGSIDEVRIWNTVLSDATILQNYNKRIDPTTSGLTGYWTFSEGSGTMANNSVSGGPKFTLFNAPTWTTSVPTIIPLPSPPCFREGTLISCSINGVETEVPIENLKDAPYLIKTLKHGYLPIHSIGKSVLHNPGNRERIQERLYKLSPLNYPEIYTPLYLTGCHGILVPSLTDQEIQACKEQYENKLFVTDGHYRLFACLDERAEPFDQEGDFNIYHVALQSENQEINYGIYANGLLVESCSIWSLTEKHKHVELMVPNKS